MIFKMIVVAVAVTAGALCNSVQARAESGAVETYRSWNDDLKTYTMQLCNEYDVDPALTLGVIYNESRFQSGLTHLNSNGTIDYGLMQVNEVNFDYLHQTIGINSISELLDDKVGLRCGIQLLAYHKGYASNDSDALLRYQVGAGKYKKFKNSGKTTTETHRKVLEYRNEFEEYFAQCEENSMENSIDSMILEQRILDLIHRWSNSTFICWSGAMVAQEICNFQVAGSSPVFSIIKQREIAFKV